MLLLLQLQIVQKVAHGNSSTASKLQTARSIAISGAVKGSANFDGSGNVTINTSQNNIFVLTGKMTIDGKTGDTDFAYSNVHLSFPSGLNRDNCVVLAFGTKNSDNIGYTYGNLYSQSTISWAMLFASGPKAVSLGGRDASNDWIIVHGSNYSDTAITFYYKIVLMKVS